MSTDKKPTDFKTSMQELDELLAWFESDAVTLEEALKKYEQALKLTAKLEVQLTNAKNNVEVIKQKFTS